MKSADEQNGGDRPLSEQEDSKPGWKVQPEPEPHTLSPEP